MELHESQTESELDTCRLSYMFSWHLIESASENEMGGKKDTSTYTCI